MLINGVLPEVLLKTYRRILGIRALLETLATEPDGAEFEGGARPRALLARAHVRGVNSLTITPIRWSVTRLAAVIKLVPRQAVTS